SDNFTYKVIDRGDPDNCTGAPSSSCSDTLESAVKNVPITITPVNDPPAVRDDSPQSGSQYSDPISPVTITASDNDSDLTSLSASTYGWKLDGAATFNTTTKPLSDPSVSGSGLDLSAPTTDASSRKWTLSGRA